MAHNQSVRTLRALLLACDASARLDRNLEYEDGSVSYEVRMSGQHVGFVKIAAGGQITEWI